MATNGTAASSVIAIVWSFVRVVDFLFIPASWSREIQGPLQLEYNAMGVKLNRPLIGQKTGLENGRV
jgi:hypothetical protein